MKTLFASSFLVFVLFFLMGTVASADSVSVISEPNSQLVQVAGLQGGAASEIYELMEKAGVQIRRAGDGSQLLGRNLSADLTYLNGARYSMKMTIDSTSGLSVQDATDGKRVCTSGAAAEELYTYMEKSGLPRHLDVDGNHIQGTHESCQVLFLGQARYSCSVEVHSSLD